MLEARTTVTEGGRIVIPAHIRKAMNIHVGEEILLKIEAGELQIVTLQNVVKNAQASVRRFNKKNISLKDALFKMRREDAEDED